MFESSFRFNHFECNLKIKSIAIDNEKDMNDWLQLYHHTRMTRAEKQQINHAFIKSLAKINLLQSDSFFLFHDGSVIKAVGRLENSTIDSISYIPDIYYSSKGIGTLFIDSFLDTARDNQSSRIIAWISENDSKTLDILGSFTFEPRLVHLLLRALLIEKPDISKIEPSTIIRKERGVFPIHKRRTTCLSLKELARHYTLRWTSLFYEPIDDHITCYISEAVPELGWIQFGDNLLTDYGEFKNQLDTAIQLLYYLGVRELYSEINIDRSLKDTFLGAGFGIDSTIYQMELELFN